MSSLSERLFAAVDGYLQAIDGTGDYNTDAGDRVVRNRAAGVNDTYPCLRLWDGGELANPDKAGGANMSMEITQTIFVDAFVAATATAGAALLQIKADVKRALLDYDRQTISDASGPIAKCLSYVGAQPVPVQEGAQHEGVTLTFTTVYKERYGNPDAH